MAGLWRWIDRWRIWRLPVWTLERAPFPLALLLGGCYARAAGWALRAKRQTVLRNLSAAGIDSSRMTAEFRKFLSRFVAVLVRFPRLGPHNLSSWLRVDGLPHLQEAVARGRGVLLLSGHLGHWELGAFGLACLGFPLQLIVYESPHRSLEEYLQRLRTHRGNGLISSKGAARQAAAALRRNQLIATLMDVHLPGYTGVAEVPFLGGVIRATTALTRLAWITGATVLPVFTLWSKSERRFVLQIHAPLALSGDPVEDTRRLYSKLESAVRQHPEQWFWIFDPGWIR